MHALHGTIRAAIPEESEQPKYRATHLPPPRPPLPVPPPPLPVPPPPFPGFCSCVQCFRVSLPLHVRPTLLRQMDGVVNMRTHFGCVPYVAYTRRGESGTKQLCTRVDSEGQKKLSLTLPPTRGSHCRPTV